MVDPNRKISSRVQSIAPVAAACTVSTDPCVACWVIVPIIMLTAFGGFVFLWLTGNHYIYFQILKALAIPAFRFPFLDTHAILAAAECHNRGFDVYLNNPCDALLRPHAQSPLWLSLVPRSLGAKDTAWVGLLLDLVFILSVAMLFRPRSLRDITVSTLAVLSSAVLFAVERANTDLVIFILLFIGAWLGAASILLRRISYVLFMFAGFLKYYPFVLLAMLAREDKKTIVIIMLLMISGLLAFILCYHDVLREAFSNIPEGSYFNESFWAMTLPGGFSEIFGLSGRWRTLVSSLLLIALTMALIARAWRSASVLRTCAIDWRGREMCCLTTAALLVPFCFVASENNLYRGIFLLLAVPGLLHLWVVSDDAAIRRWMGKMIFAIIFLLWDEHHLLPSPHGSWLVAPLRGLQIVVWLVRALIWWWLCAGLVALAVSYARDLPLVRQLFEKLRELRSAPAQ